mmetsp:Transcript_24205/g.11619  ORF Transcript_24205/g.11619 Transcript_24205/m.11619 type:complete len:81 (-) Transcript_24205:221-463(-)
MGSQMFFLVSGNADIIANNRVVASPKDGAYFGEVAMLYEVPRTATVVARSFCHLYMMDKQDLERILENYPECIDTIYGTA